MFGVHRGRVRNAAGRGLAKRRQVSLNCSTPQSRASRHLFFAERECTRFPALLVLTNHVHFIGRCDRCRNNGARHCHRLSVGGYPVTLLETTQGALEQGLQKVREHFQRAAQKGGSGVNRAEAISANATGTLSYGDLTEADLISEAAFESMNVKRQIFEALGQHAKPGAILASNTSTLDLDEIAAATSRPEDVIGLHFFSPANVMRLLEVVRGAKTAADVIATAVTVAKKIRKLPVTVGVCYGFVGNRMLEPYFREGSRLLLEGRRRNRWMTSLRTSVWPWAFTRWQIWPGSMWAPACVRSGAVKSRMTRHTKLCRTGCLN